MSFVKIHPSQANAIQCSVLCPRIIRRHTYYVSRGARSCTPVFRPQQWNIPRHIVCRQATFLIEMVIYLFSWKKVWYFNKQNETLRTREANSHLPSRCPPHLGTNGQIFQVSNCPQYEWQDQIKFPRILSWNISEDIRFTPSQRQSFHSPAGTRLARFKHDLSQVMGS